MTPDGHIPERDAKSQHAPHPHDELDFALPPPATLTPARGLVLAIGVVAVLGGAFAIGYVPNRRARAALETTAHADAQALLRVEIVAPKPGASDRALALPGSVHPLEETVIYSRANGYVKKWYADIGDKVKEGDLLVEVETPELDQELLQAKAQLAQAEASVAQATASRDLAKTELERSRKLTAEGLASQQEVDQKSAQAQVTQANLAVAQANVGAQHANIARLVQLKSFARVTAPFGGTVTQRSVDRGALVAPGNATPLYKLASLDPARIFVQVPQDLAPSVRADVVAKVTVREFPGKTFEGKVARTAGALDPSTRTMPSEIRVPNPDGTLIAGMYAEVALSLPTPHRVLVLPSTALMNDAKGLRVAVVGDDHRVKLVPVVVERDTGPTVEISGGLTGDEHVVKIAGADLSDGIAVEAIR